MRDPLSFSFPLSYAVRKTRQAPLAGPEAKLHIMTHVHTQKAFPSPPSKYENGHV